MRSGTARCGTREDLPPPPPPLELQGIAHRFGRRWVLRGLDLRVDDGEAVAMVGDNGAGKSTLLRIAATLLRPLRGEGRVRGADLRGDPAAVREKVRLLGDAPALYEDLTPEENLSFAAVMQGEPETRARIPGILEQVGLTEHRGTRVRRFSQGMRRRVAIGRILLAPPDLLLMDEPYASLDPGGVELANDLIREVTGRGGGVLLATHDVHSGAQVTSRILRLDRGVLGPKEGRDPASAARTGEAS